MSKPIIAIDIDDVLADNASGFVAFSNQRWGTNLTPEDYTEHWAEMWQIDETETERRAEEFHSAAVITGYSHDEAALPVLQWLRERYELIIVTSRRRSIETETKAWINQHYAGIFSSINFAGIWDGPWTTASKYRTKADICQSLGADYLIDDQLKHCQAVANCGGKSLLFGTYQWNLSDALPDGVIRVADWSAVEAYFRGRK